MAGISRRSFLSMLGVAAFCAVPGVGKLLALPQRSSTLELLVIGDSFVWGQGLDEPDKIYSLVADAIRRGSLVNARDVRVMVEAHSGSTIRFREPERKKYDRIGRREQDDPLPPEVNVGFPSMWQQVETAAEKYAADGVGGADLIIVSGGITDIAVSELLDPFSDIERLPPLITKYCRDEMYALMRHSLDKNPSARIVVLGYFPIIVEASRNSRLLKAWLESMKFPRVFQPVINNPAGRKLFFSRIKRKAVERSRMWVDLSSKELAAAVDMINRDAGERRAAFVPTPLKDEHAAETPNTRLFRIKNNGATEDPLYELRKRQCRESLAKLKRETQIDHPVRNCEIAAIAHPNQQGSRMYADAVIEKLAAMRF